MAATRIAAAVMVLVTISAASPGQTKDDDVYRAQRLVGRWRAIVNQRFEDSRAYASEETADAIEEFISPGAVRAARDRADEQALRKIDGEVERFAAAMLKAGLRRDDGSTVVEIETVEAARKIVCPVYPFCD